MKFYGIRRNGELVTSNDSKQPRVYTLIGTARGVRTQLAKAERRRRIDNCARDICRQARDHSMAAYRRAQNDCATELPSEDELILMYDVMEFDTDGGVPV